VTEAITVSGRTLPSIALRSIAAGVLAATALVAGYLAIISLAQGPAHALEQLAADAGFVAAVTAGFGIQIALFVELRAVDRRHRAGAAVTAAGTGTSVVAMLACCAHHVLDLLPIVGLSAAAVFLDDFKGPLLVVGIATNGLGIVVIARALRRARRACAVADQASA
jgi:hypothetical protein